MLRVRAEGLCFAFCDAAPLIEDASFVLVAGFTGLVGPNGAGKTTLLRLIQRELVATAGALCVEPAAATVVLCEQGVQTVSRAISAFADSDGRLARRLRGVLRLRDLERWDTLSAGQRKRWQIAAALASEPDILLLDEPTNHLDSEARQWLLRALREFRGIGLVVSHDRVLLNELTTRTLRVQRGQALLYTGPYDLAKATWEAEAQQLIDGRKRAQERVRALSQRLHDARSAQRGASLQRDTARRMRGPHDSDARGVLAKTKAEWAEATHGRTVEVLRRELERTSERLAEVPPVDKQLGGSVFARFAPATSEFIAYRPAGCIARDGVSLLAPPTLSVRRDERVFIRGANGAGKTTLLLALLEALRVPRGDVTFVPQELAPSDVEQALASVRDMPSAQRGEVLSIVAALGVDPGRLLVSAAPSPGEARKLAIALGLGRQAKAVMLDEPTNHLDLPSIERLQSALERYPGALVLITHDEGLARACTSTRWLVEHGTVSVGDAPCS
jgi:ATPase subunit of ABC transporter with duplicated ATPase domains